MDIVIATIPGDGSGTQLLDAARAVLDRIASMYGHRISFLPCSCGSSSVKAGEGPFPAEARERVLGADAVLLGPVLFGSRPDLPVDERPEALLGTLRAALDVCINVRPVYALPELAACSPLKRELVDKGFDMLLVRDLSQGVLTGERGRSDGDDSSSTYAAWDIDRYERGAIERVVRFACDAAAARRKRVASLDKAVVLETSRLWREVVQDISADYADIAVSDMLIDDAAARVISDPGAFDVIVTTGMFGDILADEISALAGVPGMLPSAEIAPDGKGLYTPNQIHASTEAQDTANPLCMILAAAQLLRYSCGLEEEARAVERAVQRAVRGGIRTPDMLPDGFTAGEIERGALEVVDTAEMAQSVCARIS